MTLALSGGYAAATVRDRYSLAFAAVAGLVFAPVSVAGLMYPITDTVSGLTAETAIVSPLSLDVMSVGAILQFPPMFAYFGVRWSALSGLIGAGEPY